MKLDLNLLSTSGMNEFNAVLNAHGLYNTEQFVLRLSPRNHELIDQIGTGGHALSEVSIETLQAYSTYLHETIHWWQHVGSTTGLLLSTCFPNQTHMNFNDIAEWCKVSRPSKSIKAWSYKGELGGNTHLDSAQALANTITNNFMDIQFFKIWLLRPELSTNLFDDPYFESQGHCFQMAYHGLISNIQPIIDPSSSFLPDQNTWVLNFRELAEANRTGYYYGSPIVRRHTSLAELWEAQASFSQMQFLTHVSPSMTLDDFRKAGILYGVYEAAFLKFFEMTGIEIPTSAVDSRIGLFLLVIDLAMNPVEGFPCDIVDYGNFVLSADPNIRFEVICHAIASEPHSFAHAIQQYSKTEYLDVSQRLSEMCGLRHLSEGWQEIARWKSLSPQVQQLLRERETFEFAPTNLVLRVLLSHFIEFTADKSAHPEFFCWPGYWKANPSSETTQLWLKHLSLFSDKANDGGIFIREFPGRSNEALLSTLNVFFGNCVLFDLTRQWILEDGPFKFDFRWLSEKHQSSEWQSWAEVNFEKLYGVRISEIAT
ncbi:MULTISPECIES: hypothetical protein [unclassified Rhizobium]|uniref:hypothetical protein n=1 Tax=unclassified Rhizobium TaxID=2613769 RepID=UPI0028891CE6|nr:MULTISPECIES: hypothetical protein [unclassified Rhizobium]